MVKVKASTALALAAGLAWSAPAAALPTVFWTFGFDLPGHRTPVSFAAQEAAPGVRDAALLTTLPAGSAGWCRSGGAELLPAGERVSAVRAPALLKVGGLSARPAAVTALCG